MTGPAVRTTRRRRVYSTAAALVALALGAGPASGQVELTLTPTMVRGPADAPVVIVEFSDYQ